MLFFRVGLFVKCSEARDEWELLSKRTDGEPEQRVWHLLAIRQTRELKSKD